MASCDIIPQIRNKNGEWVDSLLFSSLLENFKNNREEAKRVYEMVHSPSFIDWFGDWINSPETASKVVDENGEPMIVYRGGVEGYNKTSKKYLYFTNNKPEATLYSKAHITKGGQIFERVPFAEIEQGVLDYLLAEGEIDQKFIDLYPMTEQMEWGDLLQDNKISEEEYDKYSNLDKTGSLFRDFKIFKELYKSTRIESENDLTKQYDDSSYIESIDSFNELLPFFKQFASSSAGIVEPVFLSIKNPFDNGVHEDMTNDRDAYFNGHDGAFLLDGGHFLIKKGTKQVKSIENKGEFSKENDNIYYQLGSKEPLDKQIDELDQHLITFLKKFGVSFKEFDSLKDRLGIDALGATDVLNKLIWVNKERNSETIPEEVGHMITMLMGSNNPDMAELLSEITNWSEYAAIEKQYMPIYNNETQVKVEAVGKLLAKALVKNYKANGLDKGLLQKVLDSVMELINKVLEFLDLGAAMQHHEKVADKIALNVLMGNTDYVAQLKSMSPKLDYNEALKNNPHAQYIIDTFTKDKAQFKLTGSLALAGQGETIYRKSEEPIHDIDFVVDSEQEYTNIVNLLKEIGAEPVHFGWDSASKDYRTNAFFIPKPGYRVDVVERDHQRGNGWATSYKLYDNNGVEVPITAENVIAVDFFINKTGNNNKFNGIFKSYVDIYDGKMSLGRKGKKERLFSREKDQQDYVLMKPKNLTPAPSNYIYYQLTSEERSYYEGLDMNSDQRDTLSKLLEDDKATLPHKDAKFYEIKDEATGEIINLSRVSDIKGSTYTGPKGGAHASMGTAVDHILTDISAGKKDSEIRKPDVMTDAAFEKLLPMLREVHAKLTKDGSIIVGQYTPYNLDSLAAGSIDILIIKPNGKLAVYDLKTSKDKVYNGESFSAAYNRIHTGNGITRSKKDDHIAQLSIYKRLLELMGYEVEEIGIIPVHLEFDNPKAPTKILDVELEKIEARPFSNEEANKIGDKPDWVVDQDYKILDDLKIYFEKRIKLITDNQGRAGNAKAKIAELQKVKDLLKGVNVAIEVGAVIDSLYSDMLESKEGSKNIMDKLALAEKDIKAKTKEGLNEKSAYELMDKLNLYKQYADNLEVLDELLPIFEEVEDADEGSPAYKLGELIKARQKILSKYKTLSPPILDAALNPYASKKLNELAKKEYEIRKKALESSVKELEEQIGKQPSGQKVAWWKKVIRTKEARLAALKKELSNLKRDRDRIVVKKGTIEGDLKATDRDVSLLDRLFYSAIGSSDRVITLFAKKLKSKLYRNDMTLLDFKHKAKDSFMKFASTKSGRNNVTKFNEGLTVKETKWTKDEKTGELVEITDNVFVSEIDWSSYYKAQRDMFDSLKGLTTKEKIAEKTKWYKNNRETLPIEDKTIDVDGEKIVVEKGLKTTVADKVEEFKSGALTEEQFYDWVINNMYHRITLGSFKTKLDELSPEDRVDYGKMLMELFNENPANMDSYTKELTRPSLAKYTSKEYTAMRADKSKSEYYDFLVGNYFKDQLEVAEFHRLGYTLPYVPKSKRDMIIDGDVKGGLLTAWKELVIVTERDMDVYGSDMKGVIPMYHVRKMNHEEVSLDLISSILLYKQAASENKIKNELHAEAIGIQEALDTRDTDKNDNGKGVIDSLARKTGVTRFLKMDERSNSAKLFEAFVRMQLYGQTSEVEKIGNIRVDKIVNSLMSMTSLLTLGGPEFLKSIANSAQANVQQLIEASSEEFMTIKNLNRGKKRTASALRNILNDFSNPIATSLEGQIADMYQFRQGNFKNEYGDAVSATGSKKLATSSTYLFGMNAGEWENQLSLGFGMMDTIKLKDANGVEISLLDAYELVDGRAKLKDGLTKEDGSVFTIEDQEELMMKIHALGHGMNGIYDAESRIEAKMTSIGRLGTMFKNFLPATVKKRFKAYGGDQRLGHPTEGFYRTFYNAVLNQKKDLIALLMRKDNGLSPMQKANIKRAIAELSVIAMLTVITFVLKAAAGDDPKYKKSNTIGTYAYNFILYEIMRLNSELQFYLPVIGIDDQLRIFKNPSAINSTLTRMTRLTAQLFNPLEEYEQSNGFNKKGDNKLIARMLNLGGVNGANLNPQIAQEFLNYK